MPTNLNIIKKQNQDNQEEQTEEAEKEIHKASTSKAEKVINWDN